VHNNCSGATYMPFALIKTIFEKEIEFFELFAAVFLEN
jgi:hypothetical protein